MNLPSSRRQRALSLCQGLLADLDKEKAGAVTAMQRLSRIAQLIGDQELISRTDKELDGYSSLDSASFDELINIIEVFKLEGEVPANFDVEEAAKESVSEFPDYRVHSMAVKNIYALDVTEFRTVRHAHQLAYYEELLGQFRRRSNYSMTLQLEDGTRVYYSASMLGSLISGASRWVYKEASRIEAVLEFGEIPQTAISNTFEFVDEVLFDLVPSGAERLTVAYRNLAERNQENWQNVVDTCRRVIKDFADAIFPPRGEPFGSMDVDEGKYLNRIRAFVQEGIASRRQRQHVDATLTLLAELLARTDNLASRSVHNDAVTRYEAERVLIYTYLAIGDIIVLSGLHEREEQNSDRINLNEANLEDLQSKLRLPANVAAEIIKYRKHRDFRSWDDVKEVKGIGPKLLDRIMMAASI